MDLGEKRKQQQSFLIWRKGMTKLVEKTLKQLENMGIQGKMMEFIRELIAER